MRKFFIALSAVVASMAAVSCMEEKVLEPEAQEGEYVELTAGFEAGETKTTLDPTSFAVKWDAADKISVSDGGEGKAATTAEFSIKTGTISTDGTSATFAGTLAGTAKFAFYPAKNAEIWHEDGVKAKLPAKQQAVADSFDPDAAVAIATIDGTSAHFKNVGALLGVKIMNDNIKSVQVISNSKTPLAGFARVKIGTDGTITNTAASSDAVTLEGDFEKGKTYYMVVYPGEHTEGFTITYTDANSVTATFRSKVACTLERNGNVILAAMPLPSKYTWVKSIGDLQDGDVITLGNPDVGGAVDATAIASNQGLSLKPATYNQGDGSMETHVGDLTLQKVEGNWKLLIDGKTLGAYQSNLFVPAPDENKAIYIWSIEITDGIAKIKTVKDASADDDGRQLAISANNEFVKNLKAPTTENGFKNIRIYKRTGMIHKPDPADIPVIKITKPAIDESGKRILNVTKDGGAQTIEYTIGGKPAQGAKFSVKLEDTTQNWITDFNVTVANKITFNVAENTTNKNREAIVLLSLDGAKSVKVVVSQEGSTAQL